MRNIQEIKEKGKSLLLDDTVFSGALILLVGIVSFGLGQLSVLPHGEAQTAGVVMTAEPPAAAQTNIETDPSSSRRQYVGSINSDKYHAAHCPGADRIKPENQIWFQSETDAQAAGYTLAGNCTPLE